MNTTDRHLRKIARSGPFLRGTPEWDRRELARYSLGCYCLSFGSIGTNDTKQRQDIFYHYMNPEKKRK